MSEVQEGIPIPRKESNNNKKGALESLMEPWDSLSPYYLKAVGVLSALEKAGTNGSIGSISEVDKNWIESCTLIDLSDQNIGKIAESVAGIVIRSGEKLLGKLFQNKIYPGIISEVKEALEVVDRKGLEPLILGVGLEEKTDGVAPLALYYAKNKKIPERFNDEMEKNQEEYKKTPLGTEKAVLGRKLTLMECKEDLREKAAAVCRTVWKTKAIYFPAKLRAEISNAI